VYILIFSKKKYFESNKFLNFLKELLTSSAVLYHTRWSQKLFAKRSQTQIINLRRKERPILSYVTRYNIGRCPKNSNPFQFFNLKSRQSFTFRSIDRSPPPNPAVRPSAPQFTQKPTLSMVRSVEKHQQFRPKKWN
jgi:hypothetical protein